VTPDELSSIRQRDVLTPRRWMPLEAQSERQARLDRRDLLAEVDLLTAALADTMDELDSWQRAGPDNTAAIHERTRITAAVESIPSVWPSTWSEYYHGMKAGMERMRSAVLAAVKGE
jgi:hypothetical protein